MAQVILACSLPSRPHTHKYGLLRNKAGEARHAHRHQATDDECHRHQGHLGAEAAKRRDVTGVRLIVDHANASKEERRHGAMRKHLQSGARNAERRQGGHAQRHKAHMRNRRKANHVFEVALHHGHKGAVDNVDQRQKNNPWHPVVRTSGQQHHANAQRSKRAELHQYAGMKHRHCGRRGHVPVRAPVVEREDARQHSEAKENKREPETLEVRREMRILQCKHVERVHAGRKVHCQRADNRQHRANK